MVQHTKLTAAVVPGHWLPRQFLLPPSLQTPSIFLMQACTLVACRVVPVFQHTLCRSCLPLFSWCCLYGHGMLRLGSCSTSSQLAHTQPDSSRFEGDEQPDLSSSPCWLPLAELNQKPVSPIHYLLSLQSHSLEFPAMPPGQRRALGQPPGLGLGPIAARTGAESTLMAPKQLAQPAKVIECDDDRQCRICWGEEDMSLTRSTVDGMLVAPCSCAGVLQPWVCLSAACCQRLQHPQSTPCILPTRFTPRGACAVPSNAGCFEACSDLEQP